MRAQRLADVDDDVLLRFIPALPTEPQCGFMSDPVDEAWYEVVSKFSRERKLRILREEAEKDEKVMDHLLRLLLKHQMA